MSTIQSRIRKSAAFPSPFNLAMRAGRGLLASPGRTVAKALTRPGIGDRVMGATLGAGVGADQGSRATGSEAGGWTGGALGAMAGGLYGASGTRFRRGPAALRPVVRNTLSAGGAGAVADYAAGEMGYDTNFSTMGVLGGAGSGMARRMNPQLARKVNQTANTMLDGSMRPMAWAGDKIVQGARRMQGKVPTGISPTGKSVGTPFANQLGAAPPPGGQRFAHNLGVAAGAVPLAAGAYGMASAAGSKVLDNAANVVGQNIQDKVYDTASNLAPALTQYVRNQADDYAGTRLPAITQVGLEHLQQQGVLGRNGGLQVNLLPDWMRNPQQTKPGQWLQNLYQRYNVPANTGVGYH